MASETIEAFIENNQFRFQDELFELLRIPSIGTDPAYVTDTRRAASWLHAKFKCIGLQTELIETCGQPLVFAQSPPVAGAPTVLIYGHYDVQPPDPLGEWTTPPFEPTIRDGNVYARGATDNKGQLLTHVFGVESYLQTKGKLPIQVKFLIEGEEESGGAGLKAFFRNEPLRAESAKEKLRADIAVISDCSQYASEKPAITHGLRGGVYFEVILTGPNRDLHSGYFGGSVSNPANALCSILGSIVDQGGRIQIPGFYDEVQELSNDEQVQLQKLDFSENQFRDEVGANELFGEKGYSTLQRRWCRPSFDIHGLTSGYQDAGAKTVLPALASAKFSFRLVPHQNPQKIKEAVVHWLEEKCPPGIQFEVNSSAGVAAFVLETNSKYMQAAAAAIQAGFGRRPVYIRSGGSIPVVSLFTNELQIDTLLLGWGQDDDNLHSPNEKFSLNDFQKGIKTSCHLLDELAVVFDVSQY